MKSLLRFALCLLALSCIAGASPLSPFTSPFTFTYTATDGSGDWASAALIANDNGDGSFTAVSGNGTYTNSFGSYLISLFVNPIAPGNAISPSGYFYYDNQLYPHRDPVLNSGGLLFTFSTPTATQEELNIWATGPWSYTAMTNTGHSSTETPEPTTFAFMGVGLVGLGLIRRKKAQQLAR
jgi:hypothetical protein